MIQVIVYWILDSVKGNQQMVTIQCDLIEQQLVVAEYMGYTRFLVGSGVE